MSNSENNRRIAKNTLMLYIRMLLIMAVSLYTVRVVLKTLGIVDYGIYNVVGGVVLMFSFLSNTMASASQRYFAFELGRNNILQLRKTFSMTVTIYLIIAVVILIMAETAGLWFLNTKMTIPSERLSAANWVYQFAILSFIVTMLTVPYNAAIIAHERMNMYAYVSIIEAVLKLMIVYILTIFSYDKLKLYVVLTFSVTIIITSIYRSYCKQHFHECRYRFNWNSPLFRELIGYSGWNLFGAFAGILNNQGINILLNIFFGPVVNAARGIAYQVNSSINQFVLNFMTATRPQITKYYAAGEKENMLNLVLRTSKFSFLLLLVLSTPVILETKYILTLWLKEIPDYVIPFIRLVILLSLIDSLSFPLMTAAQATGKIRKYQTMVGGLMLFNLPISFLLLKLNFPPQSVMYVALVISIFCLLIRLRLLEQMIGLSLREYLKKVLLSVTLTSIVAYIIPLIIMHEIKEGINRFLVIGIISLLSSSLASYLISFSYSEQRYSLALLKNLWGRLLNRNPKF